MGLQIHVRKHKHLNGYIGSVVCVMRGRRLWSESSGIVRTTLQDARQDGQWLKEQHIIAGEKVLPRQ